MKRPEEKAEEKRRGEERRREEKRKRERRREAKEKQEERSLRRKRSKRASQFVDVSEQPTTGILLHPTMQLSACCSFPSR